MKYKIIIPGELPALNEIIDASKSHHMKYAKLKKEHTESIAWIAKAGIGKELNKINLYITWHCKNRRKDKDNIAVGVKFILDGLVEAGIIKNDGWREVGTIKHNFQVDKDNPRVEVLIREER